MPDLREVHLREVLRDLSRTIKAGKPITLSNVEIKPPEPNSTARVDLAAIKDVLHKNASGVPQAFSGASDDAITPAELQ